MSAGSAELVTMPAIPEQRWSCHSTGDCCRALVGHLFEADRERIDQQAWTDVLDAPPYVRAGRGWALNKRPDGACVFLDDKGLCLIHAKHGEAAKPLACRVFPFSLRRTHSGWQVSLRFDCPSVTSSRGKPIDQYRGWLGTLARQLGDCEKAPEQEDTPNLQRRVPATSNETDGVTGRLTRWLDDRSLPFPQRLSGAARVTTLLASATLRNVRGPRFLELLDLLFGALPTESAEKPEPPASRQRGMLRQLAFAHAEHVSLEELRRGLVGKCRMRWQQLLRSRRFLAGAGPVPSLPGFEGDTNFEAIEHVGVSMEQGNELEELLTRYVTGRLRSRTVFGAGYYGWPVFDGLTALWLSLAAAGWLARYAASAAGRNAVTFDDQARCLGIVDRAATRLPVLGTVTERTRARYLVRDDGVTRLLHEYAPLPTKPSR